MALFALCFGIFMTIMDVNVVNIALPTMAHHLHGDISWLQWVVAGYALTFSCMLLPAGHLGDRFNAKVIYLTGLILFVATSIACGLSNDFLTLTICRFLQGASGAMLVPTSARLINSSYDNNRERTRAIGIWATMGGISASVAPLIGGILTAAWGWRAVFYINVPVGVFAIILTFLSVKDCKEYKNSGVFDFLGQTTAIISLAALAFALIEAGRLGWTSVPVLIAFSIFIIVFGLFLMIERKVASPMFPLSLFQCKPFSATVTAGLLMNLGIYGELFLLPIYFQEVKGYSVFLTSLAILPQVAFGSFSSYLSGRISSQLGPRLPMIIGLIVSLVGFFSFMLLMTERSSYVELIIPLILVGSGMSFAVTSANVSAIHAVEPARAGLASGTFSTSRQLGSLIGVSMFGTIVGMSKNFVAGFHLSLWIATVGFLVAALMVTLWVRAPKETRELNS